ncbi:MAG: Ig-like domain-containing protein, partial [Candidatus Marinimicrobia bacterium]|nr:Ig-like domain-containing protein [Candidatus Neomarinimicrobiota bacterium]
YYKLYTANRERMDNINTNYTIPNPTSDTPASSLVHNCLTTDTPSTKGTISMEPYPDGGYDFAYYEESLLGTLTIRPNSELKPNTTYTITVNNDLDASSFCRPLEKIVLSDNFSFSFTTVDNVTPYLIGHYTFNSIDNQSLLDHSDPDGNWQDATFKQSGSAYSLVSSDLENGFDDETEGAVNFSNNFYAEISTTNSFNLSDNFSISLWFKNSNSDFPLVNWSSPNFSLGVRSQTPRLTQNQNLDCSSSIEVGYWNHLVVTVTDTEQKIYLNGNDCGTKNENGPFNYNNPLIRIGWDGGSNYSNGAIDELKFFNQILDDGEVKKLFINTGRSLEGYYPLGDKIDVSGSVRDLSGNDFHGRIRDQNKNVITSITAQQNYEKKSNRSSYFGRDRFVEVDYQESLNPEKFSLVGWIKPNNDLDTLEGIISSEHNDSINGNKGYGLYRWIYRSYKEIVSTDYNTDVRNSQDLFKRNGATEDSHENNGTCTQKRFRPSTSNMGSGPNLCEPPLNSNGTCADRDFKHLYAWTNPSPYTHIYENQGSIVCRGIDDPGTRLFEFWTRPAADFTDTSGSGKGKGPSLLNAPNYGFNIFYGRDESGNSKKLLSYDRRNNNDSTIQDSKLFLPVANNQIGAPDTFPYKIHEKDINNWIMFIAKWDGTQQKIQLRNYFDADNNPGKHEIFDNSSYQPVRNGASKLYIGHGYGDGFYSGDYKLNLFKGNIDDIRVYSRVISEDEIDTIFNLSDSEPPVPGSGGSIIKSGSCSLSWTVAEDDVTSTSNLEYKVVGISGANRISTVESALINDTLNNNWSQSTSATVAGLGGGFVNILVKDEGGNMTMYDGVSCP